MVKQLVLAGLIILPCLFQNHISAQSFYVKGGLELRGAAHKGLVGIDREVIYNASTQSIEEEYTEVISSFGKGYNFTATLGKNITNYLSVELDFGFTKSQDITIIDHIDFIGLHRDEVDYVISTNTFSASPGILLQLPDKKVSPFISLGYVMAFPMMTETATGEFQVDEDEKQVREFDTRLSSGYRMSTGVEWQMNNKIVWVADIGLTHLVFEPKSSKITKYEVGGRDERGSFTDAQLESNYSRTYQETYRIDPQTGDLERVEEELINVDEPAFQLPFSSVNFGLRIKYYFGQ